MGNVPTPTSERLVNMAKARAIVKRRKAVENIRKITRTMELIATNRFQKALNRATEAEAYTRKIVELVADLGELLGRGQLIRSWSGTIRSSASLLLVLTSNRGLAGGYNGNVLRAAIIRLSGQSDRRDRRRRSRSRASGASTYFRFRKMVPDATYTQFEDRPQFEEVEVLADRYIKMYVQGTIDRLDVAFTQFVSSSRQIATVQTLLPITTADIGQAGPSVRQSKPAAAETPRPRPRRRGAGPLRVPARRAAAFSRRSCRSRSRSGCSSASSTPRSASRSLAWSPWAAPPRTPTTSSSRSRASTTAPARTRSPASWPISSAPRPPSDDLA